jgi:hypothetical protein
MPTGVRCSSAVRDLPGERQAKSASECGKLSLLALLSIALTRPMSSKKIGQPAERGTAKTATGIKRS